MTQKRPESPTSFAPTDLHITPIRFELSESAWVDYYGHFLTDREGDILMKTLIEEEAWAHRPIIIFGKEIPQPRLISWGGSLPYRYSGQTLPPRSIHSALNALWGRVEEACGHTFNHVLLNYYRDGDDNMGMHADDEVELGRNPKIAALSIGVKRRFKMNPKRRRKDRRQRRHEGRVILLHHGSLMVMGGDMQHTWRHGVPKMKPQEESGPRINITFRQLLGAPGEVKRAQVERTVHESRT